MKRYSIFAPSVALCLALTEPLAAQDDADAAKVVAEIAELHELFDQGAEKNNGRALAAIRTAMATPKAAYELYMDSRKKMDFDDAGKSESDWRKWRDQNEARYKDPAHLKARQYQLRYLALSIGASAAGDDPEEIAALTPKLLSFLDDVTAAAGEIGGQRDVLDQSVMSSTYARRMKLDLTLDPDVPWCYAPLDINSIYEVCILPSARATKDVSKISSAWDRRILHEARVATMPASGVAGGLPDIAGIDRGDVEDLIARFGGRGQSRDAERKQRREDERRRGLGEKAFKTERLPELKWSKARDELVFGSNRAAGLSAMVSLFKANTNHPKARTWLDELSSLSKQTDYDPAVIYKKK